MTRNITFNENIPLFIELFVIKVVTANGRVSFIEGIQIKLFFVEFYYRKLTSALTIH